MRSAFVSYPIGDNYYLVILVFLIISLMPNTASAQNCVFGGQSHYTVGVSWQAGTGIWWTDFPMDPLFVDAKAGCEVYVKSDQPWLTVYNLTSDRVAGYTGEWRWTYTPTVTENPDLGNRNGILTFYFISGTATTAAAIIQYPKPDCTYSIDPLTTSFGPSGGTDVFSIKATPNSPSVPPTSCKWVAWSKDSWITSISPSSGFGDDSITYSVDPNTGTQNRIGQINVAGTAIQISEFALLQTMPASNPTLTTANLNGAVVPSGTNASVWFQWGTGNNTLTSNTPEQVVTGGNVPIPVSATISNLKPGVPYYFQIVARFPSGTRFGDVLRLIILMGKPPSGSRYPEYWNKYDRLIFEHAHQANLYAPLVKAVIALESSGLGMDFEHPEWSYLYEPATYDERYVTKAISNKTLPSTLNNYVLPDYEPSVDVAPYNHFWHQRAVIPKNTTNKQMMDENYLSRLTHGFTNRSVAPKSEFVAQYRLAASYGLGQVVYWEHHDLLSNIQPEAMYNPQLAIETSANVLKKNRDWCAANATSTTTSFDSWIKVLRAYNCGKCDRDPGQYAPKVKTKFPLTQPALASDAFNPSSILVPQQVVGRQAEPLAQLSQRRSLLLSGDEYEVDRLVADFKGSGKQQLAILYFSSATLPTAEDLISIPGGLKIFTDDTGQTVEWQSPLVLGTAGEGQVFISTLLGGGPPLIIMEWAAGAHGMWNYLFRWNGSTFAAVQLIDSGGIELSAIFGDAGVQITPEGQLVVAGRDADRPLSLFNAETYVWTGQSYQWSKQETISIATYFLSLPFIVRLLEQRWD